jgi:hypothetical protein
MSHDRADAAICRNGGLPWALQHPWEAHAAEGLEEALGLSWGAELSEQDRFVVS